jgi:hypothetical protein
MARQATTYFDQLSSTVSPALRNAWEKKITSAEKKRLAKPSVMDVIGAQQTNIVKNNSGSGQRPMAESRSPTELRWLNISMSIEEQQYVWIVFLGQIIIKLRNTGLTFRKGFGD